MIKISRYKMYSASQDTFPQLSYSLVNTTIPSSSDEDFLGRTIGWYFRNPNNTITSQIISSFVFGLILSPWSISLVNIVIFIVIVEVLWIVFTGLDSRYYNPITRLAVLVSYFAGFLIGRILAGYINPFMFDNDEVMLP